jgi:hypothetical protein
MKKDVQLGCFGQRAHPIGAGEFGWLLGEQGLAWIGATALGAFWRIGID